LATVGVIGLNNNIFDFVFQCLGDALAKAILDCLELLEGLSRSLDKEYKYGACKCWKHAAEYFGIEEEEYQNFKCTLIHSPTEVMFEYLQTCSPEMTVADVKGGLHSIGRQNVIDVLTKYEQSEYTTGHVKTQTADHADCSDHADCTDWEFFLTNLLFFSFFYLGFLNVCLHILFTFCYAYRFLEARYGSGKMYNQ